MNNNNYSRLIASAIAFMMLSEPVEAQMSSSPDKWGYFDGGRYQNWSANEKLEALWKQCIADTTPKPVPYNELPSLFTRNIDITYTRTADELPEDRPKINHAQGVVGLVSWEDLGGHDYTGLFEGGSDLGLIRMSEANFDLPEAPGLTPSLAIKFLRDGMKSVNHLANVSFGPTDSFNFFANNFRSKIPLFEDVCAQETIQKKFTEISTIFNYDTLG